MGHNREDDADHDADQRHDVSDAKRHRPELTRPKSLEFTYRNRAIGTGVSVVLPIGAGSFDPRSAKVDPAALAHGGDWYAGTYYAVLAASP